MANAATASRGLRDLMFGRPRRARLEWRMARLKFFVDGFDRCHPRVERRVGLDAAPQRRRVWS
jgi:hypothetical protein